MENLHFNQQITICGTFRREGFNAGSNRQISECHVIVFMIIFEDSSQIVFLANYKHFSKSLMSKTFHDPNLQGTSVDSAEGVQKTCLLIWSSAELISLLRYSLLLPDSKVRGVCKRRAIQYSYGTFMTSLEIVSQHDLHVRRVRSEYC